ncbi:tail fiber protein, partial [Paenibacillus alvei]
MGAFGGIVLTNKGRNLQAKAQTGIELKYTRIGIGDGQLVGQSIPTLTKLINEKKSLPLTKLKLQGQGKAVLGAVLSNQEVTTGFYFREVGVFAQDPDEGEILYGYGNSGANAEYIPPAGGADIIEKSIDAIIIVGQAQNVSAIIDSSLIFASQDDVDAAEARAKAYTDQKVKDIDLSKITPESIGAAKQTDFTAHLQDNTKHITVSERNDWNSKAAGSHKHDASDITTGTMAAARLPGATTSAAGIVQLSTATNGTRANVAATESAVKAAYDRANEA